MIFSIVTELCNHYQNLSFFSSSPKKTLYSHTIILTLAITNPLSVSTDFLVLDVSNELNNTYGLL